jgi:hypothetical protein
VGPPKSVSTAFFLPSLNYFYALVSRSLHFSSLFPLGRQQTMTDISDDQVDELLRKAEQRLKDGSASAIVSTNTSNAVVAGDAATTKNVKQQKSSDSSSKKDGLTVRAPPQPQLGLKAKEKVRRQTPISRASTPFAIYMKKIYPKHL